jgi:hypothetical protein
LIRNKEGGKWQISISNRRSEDTEEDIQEENNGREMVGVEGLKEEEKMWKQITLLFMSLPCYCY